MLDSETPIRAKVKNYIKRKGAASVAEISSDLHIKKNSVLSALSALEITGDIVKTTANNSVKWKLPDTELIRLLFKDLPDLKLLDKYVKSRRVHTMRER